MDFSYNDKINFPALGSGLVRAPGLHMTNVLRYIMKKTDSIKTAEGWDMRIAAEVGFIWEDLLSLIFATRMLEAQDCNRPGEIIQDSIICSPDGWGLDPGWSAPDLVIDPGQELIIEEYKCTWRSINKLPHEYWYWMAQCKGYCKVLNCQTVIMRILYLNGNYKGSGPLYREVRITFTQEEIDSNWDMILVNAEEMRKEGEIVS